MKAGKTQIILNFGKNYYWNFEFQTKVGPKSSWRVGVQIALDTVLNWIVLEFKSTSKQLSNLTRLAGSETSSTRFDGSL